MKNKEIGKLNDNINKVNLYIKIEEILNSNIYFKYEKYKGCIDTALKTLTPKQEQIIRLRYGLTDNGKYSIEVVGKELHVTREFVRQIELKAISSLFQAINLLNSFKDFNIFELLIILDKKDYLNEVLKELNNVKKFDIIFTISLPIPNRSITIKIQDCQVI